MSSNVGGSAGDQGFQFQAKIIAFIAVHMLAEASITNLEQDIEGIPIVVAAETNGPGDNIRIEFDRPKHFIELQAKKGLHIGDRFDKTVEKIAAGLRRDTMSSVVLAVDPTATSRIRQKLPLDLRRLRQGREDTPHDRNLFNRVMQFLAAHAEDEEETRALAKRLFVYTFDVEKADLQTALNLLRSRILVDEQQAKATWNLLVQAGHELISERGRYDATSLVRFIQRESAHTIHLRASLLPVAKNRYQAWLSANTATFRIPGPAGKSLPITTAWAELHVLSRQDVAPLRDVEELLKHYHEWERIASRADEDGYRAKDVAEIGYRVVITGGPGAGKSTLCRKLAHDLTGLEEVVMWIDLPAFASRIQRSTNIKTALVDTSTDGFDAPFEVREALLAQADCLIADGLDECGDSVVAVAQALQRWATDHPFTRIVITSRPIGYETAYFPEWEHYDLMPFTKDQIQSSSWELIQALASDPTTVEQEVARFQEQLKEDHIASLAARNPLLLGFLIQLSLEGEDLAQQRAGLYEQILNLWRTSHPQGRNWQVPQLDGLLAWRSLELIGWSLLSTEKGPAARSHDKLVQQLSQQLAHEMGTRPLKVSATANKCLHFWHERGVVDRFQVGHQEVYTFVHATFHEYAAGRYLASLSLPEIRQWVRDKYRDTRWREPILLAAGCGAVEVIVETLLAIDAEDRTGNICVVLGGCGTRQISSCPRPTHPVSHQPAHSSPGILQPTLAYEVAEHGLSLVKRMPDVFASLLQPLFQHPQHWTRLSALYLALEAKEIRIDADELEAFLSILSTETLPRRGEAFPPGWDLQNRAIVLGAERLARIRPDARTKDLLQALYDDSEISVGTQWELRRVLLGLGCDEFIQERDRREEEKFKGGIFDPIVSEYRAEADRKVLETILRLTSSPFTSAKKRSKLRALALLLYALHVPESRLLDYAILRRLDDVQAIEAVLLGYIAALRLDKEELAQDAAWALAELQKTNQDGIVGRPLLSLLPKFPVGGDIHTIDALDVRLEDLIRALRHPSSIIVYGVVRLLAAAGEGREEIVSLLFTSKDTRLLYLLAQVAGPLWGMDARPLLMKRLDQGYTPGSWWLIEALPSLPGEHTDQQFQQMLLRALQAEEPRIAIAAVHALQQLDISLLRGMVPALQSALLYWAEQGERAKARSFYRADDCPTCRTEPGNAYAHVSHLTDQL